MVKSKWGLAFSAMITVFASLLMSVSLCVFFGLAPTLSGRSVQCWTFLLPFVDSYISYFEKCADNKVFKMLSIASNRKREWLTTGPTCHARQTCNQRHYIKWCRCGSVVISSIPHLLQGTTQVQWTEKAHCRWVQWREKQTDCWRWLHVCLAWHVGPVVSHSCFRLLAIDSILNTLLSAHFSPFRGNIVELILITALLPLYLSPLPLLPR